MPEEKRITILSAEQALSMPYATQRFVQLGWRVIKLEPTPVTGRKAKGDPNRYIGRPVAGEDRGSYFVTPNAGKEAIAVDLKNPGGRNLLTRLLDKLGVDVFCTNTLPVRYEELGISPGDLCPKRPGLVWCSISAMGHANPDVPGYDPMIQALCGFMDLTGDPAGPPMQCGIPLVDLKAGDEVFAQVLLALWNREKTGFGRTIDVSMAQVAASWLPTFLPMLDLGSRPSELKRSGNQHRQFIPVNAYPTSDGYLYIAIGSDAQWARLVQEELFSSLDLPAYRTNEGRRRGRESLHQAIAAITSRHTRAKVAQVLARAEIPNSPITPIEKVGELPFVRDTRLETTAPDGRKVRLVPPSFPTPHLEKTGGRLPFAPAYGEHTDKILLEAGVSEEELSELRGSGVVA